MKRSRAVVAVAVAGLLLAGVRPANAWQFQLGFLQGQGGGGYGRPVVVGNVGLAAADSAVGLVGGGGGVGGVSLSAGVQCPPSGLLYGGLGSRWATTLVEPTQVLSYAPSAAAAFPVTVPYGVAGFSGASVVSVQAPSPAAPLLSYPAAVQLQASVPLPSTSLSLQRTATLLETMESPAAGLAVGVPGPGDLSRQVDALARAVERLTAKVKEHDARLQAPAMPRPTPE